MMKQEDRDELFLILTQLSDAQFDPAPKAHLKTLMGRPNEEIRKELLFLLDDCVYGSLCSSFEIAALDAIYHSIGGSEQEKLDLMQERKERY